MADLKDSLKARLRRLTNMLGYDVVAFDRKNSRWRLSEFLSRYRITLLFDVGANLGHFGWDMRELGFTDRIVSFEPLKDAFAQLQKTVRKDPAWQAVNVGLGDRDEERLIHVASNSQSSSLLPMLAAHKEAAPESLYERDEMTSIRRLDSIFADYATAEDKVFLKIDTQGFEKRVLDGAHRSLAAVPLVQLECSLVPLYDGDNSVEDMIGYMRALGYDPVDLQPIFYHRNTSHLMQIDAVFIRRAGLHEIATLRSPLSE